jgi:hypothetical protein
MLAAAKTFFRWCVAEKKWLPRSPLEQVKGIGKIRHGKEQLRIDEARKWMTEARRLADQGNDGARRTRRSSGSTGATGRGGGCSRSARWRESRRCPRTA